MGKLKQSVSKAKPRIQVLGYGFPRPEHDREAYLTCTDDFDLHDLPLRSSDSFLDFDAVVICAGAFELAARNSMGFASTKCISTADLDRREKEAITALNQRKPVLFLVSDIYVDSHSINHNDLFPRIAWRMRIGLEKTIIANPFMNSNVPEFHEYVSRFASAYVKLTPGKETADQVLPLCTNANFVFGVALADLLFILPSVAPDRQGQVTDIATCAIQAIFAYRRRISRAVPDWVTGFSFSNESELIKKSGELRDQLSALEAEAARYADFKNVLCLQSDPLVESVRALLDHFFGIMIVVDDQCIEDATIRDDQGKILAVIEIKGVKGAFKRANVNQIDNHRERLNVPAATTGILIMNTMLDATSLEEKDERPHHDIITKAVASNVLLIRTLDLIRYADAVDRGQLSIESFRTTILGNAGWLKVENDTAEIVED